MLARWMVLLLVTVNHITAKDAGKRASAAHNVADAGKRASASRNEEDPPEQSRVVKVLRKQLMEDNYDYMPSSGSDEQFLRQRQARRHSEPEEPEGYNPRTLHEMPAKPRVHRDEDAYYEPQSTTTAKYKVFTVIPGARRSAPRRFIQEDSPDGIVIIRLDQQPFPEFRLPRVRRQYMKDNFDPNQEIPNLLDTLAPEELNSTTVCDDCSSEGSTDATTNNQGDSSLAPALENVKSNETVLQDLTAKPIGPEDLNLGEVLVNNNDTVNLFNLTEERKLY